VLGLSRSSGQASCESGASLGQTEQYDDLATIVAHALAWEKKLRLIVTQLSVCSDLNWALQPIVLRGEALLYTSSTPELL
jgi:hypothetical protein